MNIILVSFGDYEYDGRLRELCKVFSTVGSLSLFCRSSSEKVLEKCDFTVYHGNSYWGFIKRAFSFAEQKKKEKIDILVLDNRKSIIPGFIIKKKCNIGYVIQDCRELYFARDTVRFASRIGCYIEQPSIRKANIIICANTYRAEIMKKEYKLKDTPLVYENLRKLRYSDNVDLDTLSKQYAFLIHDNEYRIIATAGCDIHRMNDVLVENMKNVKHKVRLIMVGSSFDSDIHKIESIIDKQRLNNVEYLGRVNQNQLKFLIQNCHIGIVNYGQYDLNNKYCASGKLFEFIYEGLPVVTTTNPPLKDICEKYSVGIADDSFSSGIDHILNNYEYYRKKVSIFGTRFTVENNNKQLVDILMGKINHDL